MNDISNNGEAGIAEVDFIGAKIRLSGKNGLEKQHKWSSKISRERTLGSLLSINFIVLGVAWTSISNSERFWITGTFVLGVIYIVFNALRKKSKLEELRNEQVKNYARKTSQS